MKDIRIPQIRKMNIITLDNILFSLLLLLSIFTIYIVPVFKTGFLLLSLILFYKSKKDYVWWVYFFVIIQAPGMLFTNKDISLISLTSTVHVSYMYFFIITAFIKYYIIKQQRKKYIFREVVIICYYMIFLLFISFIYGMSPASYLHIIYVIISMLLFVILPSIIKDKDGMYEILNIMYYAMIVLFLWQIFDIINSKPMHSLFKELIYFKEFNGIMINRFFYSPGISFITFCTSLYFLLDKNQTIYKKYFLNLIVFISFSSIFLTATRGLILQYSFVLLTYLLITKKSNIIKLLFIVLFTSIILIEKLPVVSNQIGAIFDRLGTLTSLVSGDLTADGTLQRLTVRGPKVWNKYLESPTFGFGYSTVGLEYNDDHVGNQTLLLQGGFVGAIIWIIVLSTVINNILKRNNIKRKTNPSYFIISIVLSIMMIHSTSSAVFTFYFEPHTVFILGFLMIFINNELFGDLKKEK